MVPVQIVRVGLGEDAIHLPLFRLPYTGGPDSAAKSGGFFVTKDGEFGIVVDARLSSEEAQRVVAAEIERNAPFLAAAIQNQSSTAASRPSLPS